MSQQSLPEMLPEMLPDYIEAEIGSYCNRRCSWCPNHTGERSRQHQQMQPGVWSALLDDLSRHNYRGWFAFHNYNEPLADPDLYNKISQLHRQVKRAKSVIYSNGNLLNKDRLERLVSLGVREVRVTRYPRKKDMYREPDPEHLLAFLRGLNCEQSAVKQDRPRRLVYLCQVGPLRLLVAAPRVSHYTTRGGSVEIKGKNDIQRDWPCYYPLASAAIDYHGNLKLCCHIYDSQLVDNAPYIIGNVGMTPFSQLWNGEVMQDLRKKLGAANFSTLPACARCSHKMVPRFLSRLKPRLCRRGLTDQAT